MRSSKSEAAEETWGNGLAAAGFGAVVSNGVGSSGLRLVPAPAAIARGAESRAGAAIAGCTSAEAPGAL
jgi:hypothetical protein